MANYRVVDHYDLAQREQLAMAQAIVHTVNSVTPEGNDLVYTFPIQFFGTDIQPDQSLGTVRIAPGDSDVTIQTKWTDVIVAEATRLGYSVARTAVRIPAYFRGR